MTVIKRGDARIKTGAEDDPLGAFTAELISDTGGLTQFDAFIETLPPGSASSYSHWHNATDEMVLMLSGRVTLTENGAETFLEPGDAAVWPAGTPVAHSLRNTGQEDARYLVIGTLTAADRVTYPDLDRVMIYDRDADTRRYETLDGKPATPPF